MSPNLGSVWRGRCFSSFLVSKLVCFSCRYCSTTLSFLKIQKIFQVSLDLILIYQFPRSFLPISHSDTFLVKRSGNVIHVYVWYFWTISPTEFWFKNILFLTKINLFQCGNCKKPNYLKKTHEDATYDASNSRFLHHNFSFELKMERFIAFFAKIESCFTTKSTSYVVFLWQSHHLSHQAWYLILLYKSVWWSWWEPHSCDCTSKPVIILCSFIASWHPLVFSTENWYVGLHVDQNVKRSTRPFFHFRYFF